MGIEKEIQYYLEDTAKQNIKALFSVKKIDDIVEVTCIPHDGFNEHQQEKTRLLLRLIMSLIEENNDEYKKLVKAFDYLNLQLPRVGNRG